MNAVRASEVAVRQDVGVGAVDGEVTVASEIGAAEVEVEVETEAEGFVEGGIASKVELQQLNLTKYVKPDTWILETVFELGFAAYLLHRGHCPKNCSSHEHWGIEFKFIAWG